MRPCDTTGGKEGLVPETILCAMKVKIIILIVNYENGLKIKYVHSELDATGTGQQLNYQYKKYQRAIEELSEGAFLNISQSNLIKVYNRYGLQSKYS